MKEFYLDVEVTVKQRLRCQFTAEEKPTNEQMLEILKDDTAMIDITDEEILEFVSVEKVGEGEGEEITEDEGEEEDSDSEDDGETEEDQDKEEGYF